MRAAWRSFGRIPSLAIFVAWYAVLVATALLDPSQAARDWVNIATFLGVILHCAARPDRRLDVFGVFVLPGVTGNLLELAFGISPRWGLVLVPVSILWLWSFDRSRRRGRPAGSRPVTPDGSEPPTSRRPPGLR